MAFVRVFLPSTLGALARLLDVGKLGPAPLTAFAVTPGLRAWYVEDDDPESLEYAALTEAARGSLRLIDADESATPRRVVVAADVPDSEVELRDDLDRGVVQLSQPVTMAQIASVHVDDPEAAEAISRAAKAVVAADLGEPSAQDDVDDAEGFELAWYASQEIAVLLAIG
jgi:hypothetical protein